MSGSFKASFARAGVEPPIEEPRRAQIPSKKNRAAPFPVRFSDEERKLLEARAGTKPLGTYIRETVLGDAQSPRKHARSKPKADQAALAQMIGRLGQADQVKCLFLLLLAAEQDRVVTGTAERQALRDACAAVEDMRTHLLSALGMKP